MPFKKREMMVALMRGRTVKETHTARKTSLKSRKLPYRMVQIPSVDMKNFFAGYLLLALYLDAAVAQSLGLSQSHFGGGPLNQRNQLSAQQQGHILSDVQQHQHRFNLHRSVLNDQQQVFPAQQFGGQANDQFSNGQQFSNPQLQQTLLQNPQFQQSLIQQQQQLLSNQKQQFSNNQFSNNQQFGNPTNQQAITSQNPTIVPTTQPLQAPFAFPTAETLTNPTNSPTGSKQFVQHHTQTGFTPNFTGRGNQQAPTNSNYQEQQQIFNQKFQVNPSVDPLFTADQTQQLQGQFDPDKQKLRLKELKDKQAIIDKHNQFVERQYEKALKKAQTDHVDFVQDQKEQKKKQYQRWYRPPGTARRTYTLNNPRYIYPEETPLFKLSVDKYYEEHPTTTTTTTTTTTPAPTTVKLEVTQPEKSNDDESPEESDHYKLLKQLTSQEKEVASSDRVGDSKIKVIQSLDDLTQLQKQYKSQKINRDDLLAQLRLAIGDSSDFETNKNISSREISLANGEKVQIIRTTDPKLIPGATPIGQESDLDKLILSAQSTETTPKPPKEILEELTKGVLPPGADFELLKHDASGGLEQLQGLPSNLPNQKKVTFVLLEEQSDGSYKVQGVKGNSEKEKSEVDVDSILQRIKDGDIKLPPPSNNSNRFEAQKELHFEEKEIVTLPTVGTTRQVTATPVPAVSVKSTLGTLDHSNILFGSRTTNRNQFVSSSVSPLGLSAINVPSTTFQTPFEDFPRESTPKRSSSRSDDLLREASTATSSKQNSLLSNFEISSTNKPTSPSHLELPDSSPTPTNDEQFVQLPDVLKRNGLYAMAKFLRQSGLDTILNETGPYTIFAPTDKAFRTLLVQLGGPEQAEEKFKENPRLLSGLLLHHVIPGAFSISSLQDEMTGVSLAGTQLRVNLYNMQDTEWNDIKITTVNGAKVLEDKKDIDIPQGIAHAVDRVMFPLPVGDIIQTLQSDRERRFTNLLRALFASGLAESLQGTKTFTLFAPTDRAFADLPQEELSRIVTEKAPARELVMRHTIPGTLYTNGMRYFQIRDSLQSGKQLTLTKSTGRVKVNNIPIATQNIPTTNGVIHALDTLL